MSGAGRGGPWPASSVNGRSSATPGRGEVGVRVGAWRSPISASHLTEEGSKATAMTSLRRTYPVSGSNLRGSYFCRTWVGGGFLLPPLVSVPATCCFRSAGPGQVGSHSQGASQKRAFLSAQFPFGQTLACRQVSRTKSRLGQRFSTRRLLNLKLTRRQDYSMRAGWG